ncbi:MAG TPA: Ig-like domain-containing protein [Bryobacteraceae bacterium]|nr:Ig-like domain-containing protein [Bryobacteraceae bacterium]
MIRRSLLTAVLLVCAFIAGAVYCYAQLARTSKVRVTAPGSGSRVSGPLRFQVQVDSSLDLRSIEYAVNGRLVSPLLTSHPYDFTWLTGNLYDSSARVKAVARDQSGEIVAESPEVVFTIANGRSSLTTVTPWHGDTIAGTVDWSLTAKVADGPGKPIYNCVVDGRPFRLHFSPERQFTMQLDTTKLMNGPHELYCSLGLELPGGAVEDGLAMSQIVVNVDNGHKPIELRHRYSDVYLRPGEQVMLPVSLVHTDNRNEIVPASHIAESPEVATVSSDGLLKAVSPGSTYVRSQHAGFSSSVRVHVQRAHVFPHLAKDGSLLYNYDAERSLFVRTVFSLGEGEIGGNARMAAAVKAAGINVISSGAYQNPIHSGRDLTFDSWKRNIDEKFQRLLALSAANDWSVLLIGDDIARSPVEMANTLTNPWAPQAIRHVLELARDSRRVIGMEAIDEVDFMWGSTPLPKDGRWLSKQPPIPDHAFQRLLAIINGVPGRPLITWPVSGAAETDTTRNWMGNPEFSDYNSLYWHFTDFRRVYPQRASNLQVLSNIDRTLQQRLPVMRSNRPTLMLTSIMGAEYVKQGPGKEYTPGQDKLLSQGSSLEQISQQVLYAVATGMAGVRAYSFDMPFMKDLRAGTPAGVGQHQTGTDPFVTGTDRWQAMSAVFNLIHLLEPYLLQPKTHTLNLGQNIFTGAKEGPYSRVLVAIHASEVPTVSDVELDSYGYPQGSTVTQYRVTGSKVVRERFPASKTLNRRVTFAPDESIIWIVRPVSRTTGSASPR